MKKLTLDDISFKGRRVLVRVDFNVPLHEADDGTQTVGDDTRIRAALPTIRAIVQGGGKAILMSHLGRPNGTPDPRLSLAPVAQRLEALLGRSVRFSTATVGASVREMTGYMENGSVLLLENTRFHAGETQNDPAFAADLAALGDVFVNDAFGTAHRAHASNVGVAGLLDQAAAGKLLQREIDYLSKVLASPAAPFVAVLGGAKVSDKIGVIENLIDRVDHLLIGGAMSYTFLKAQGHQVGKSLVEEDKLEVAAALLEQAGDKLLLPIDHVAAPAFDNDALFKTVEGPIPYDLMGLDIGPITVAAYRRVITKAKTIIWNGPMGVFEMSNYATGTRAMAEALAEATRNGALTIVGGGDSVAAITEAGFDGDVSHVSTGGGAMLAFLEGKTLPGLAALTDR